MNLKLSVKNIFTLFALRCLMENFKLQRGPIQRDQEDLLARSKKSYILSGEKHHNKILPLDYRMDKGTYVSH
jgi:hypothetical protein